MPETVWPAIRPATAVMLPVQRLAHTAEQASTFRQRNRVFHAMPLAALATEDCPRTARLALLRLCSLQDNV